MKTTEYFLNLFFYLQVQSWLIMENNFIKMVASAGLAVSYMIGPNLSTFSIVQLYFTNDFTNIVL